MRVPLALAVGLVGWSLVGNLLIGDTLYVTRNVVLTALLLLLARRAGVTWSTIGLAGEDLRAGLRWGGAAIVVVAVVVAVGTAVADQVGGVAALLGDERANLPDREVAWHALWRIPVGTALFEEVAFRGVLLALFLQVLTPGWAVGAASAVFGLWHVAPTMVTLGVNDVPTASAEGFATIAGAVAITAVAGVLFSLLRLGSGSLVAPILAHWATNSIGLLAASLTQRGGP